MAVRCERGPGHDWLGEAQEHSEVIRKLLRIGSNGLYSVNNVPAAFHQLANLTGTSIECQLGLEPIYLRGQLYPRFFNRPVQCA
jgi:hypothetical protein